jgi:hypothetical protein
MAMCALGTVPPEASLITPLSVAPDTCARNGSDITRLKIIIQQQTANLITFGFMDTMRLLSSSSVPFNF